jgi:hypothetical protein
MRRKISGVVLGVVPGLVVLAMAGSAQASIVVGKSIDGVRLGDTEAQVRKALGEPSYTMPPDYRGESSWGYPKTLEGRVGFDRQGRVNGMWTISRKQRTSKGIGPGSSLVLVRKAYPAVVCATGPFGPQSLLCTLKSRYHGRIVETSFPFFTRSAGVREVNISFG